MNLDMLDMMKAKYRIQLEKAGISSPEVLGRLLDLLEAQIKRTWNQAKIESEVATTT